MVRRFEETCNSMSSRGEKTGRAAVVAVQDVAHSSRSPSMLHRIVPRHKPFLAQIRTDLLTDTYRDTSQSYSVKQSIEKRSADT